MARWFGVPIIAAGVLPLALTAVELWLNPPGAGEVSSSQWSSYVPFPATGFAAYEWVERCVSLSRRPTLDIAQPVSCIPA